jgi:prepilin-type N-terminal cleavage/methylation domain-containing protein
MTMRRAAHGFTIMEMLVALAMLGTLVGVLLGSLLIGRGSYTSADAYVQVQQAARQAFDNMARELHGAGFVNNNVAIIEPGVQQLDFQVIRSYDAVACGGICWGTDDGALPTGWVHYVLDTANAQNVRLMRCVTANRTDPMPAGFAGCRVLANNVNGTLANTAFVYDHANRTVTLRLQTIITSTQLTGGSMPVAPPALTTQIRLRNSS